MESSQAFAFIAGETSQPCLRNGKPAVQRTGGKKRQCHAQFELSLADANSRLSQGLEPAAPFCDGERIVGGQRMWIGSQFFWTLTPCMQRGGDQVLSQGFSENYLET